MKGGTQAALALGVGYVLGRRRKMRLATLLAVAAATGGLGGLGGMALRRGAQVVGSTEALGKVAPQLGELADTVRGDLLGAGKAAATAALSNRIESLSDSIRDRADLVREPGAAAASAGEAVRGTARRGRGAAGDEDDGGPEDEEPELEEDEPAAPVRRRPARDRSPVSRSGRAPAARSRR